MEIDAMIEQIEQLYKLVTGHEPSHDSDQPYSRFPPEKSLEQHIEDQLTRLLSSIDLALKAYAPIAAPFIPPMTIWRRDSDYLICIDLPGVELSKLSLSLTDNSLLVIGDRSPPEGAEAGVVFWSESCVGAFMRVTALPMDIVAEQVRAQFKNGVLEIIAPRREAPTVGKNHGSTSRQIDIRGPKG